MCLLDSAVIAAQIGHTGLGRALLGGLIHSNQAELHGEILLPFKMVSGLEGR